MLAKKALALYAQKSIYIFLIVWVGGLAPLIYFENYSSHRGVQRLQVSLLKKPGSSKLPPAFRQMWMQSMDQGRSRGLNIQPQWVTGNISLPGINSSVTIYCDGYYLVMAHPANQVDSSPAGRVSSIQLPRRSACLPPPEKPPPFPPRLS
jgi:hypothetical protein